MDVLCLITLQPNKIWCDFLNNFKNYKIYVIIDDNDYNSTDFKNTYKNINFVQVENNKCEKHGYIDTNFTIKKLISGWDKALYYFGVEYITEKYIWFIEDDVYFYDESTLLNIDKQYTTEDLLSNKCDINENGEKTKWHWRRIKIEYTPPYYWGMMCAVRFSKKMIKSIDNYAKSNKTLFFLEALFPTIAMKNNLICVSPEELNEIYYRRIFSLTNINHINMYHPMKDLNKHILLRKLNNK